MELLQVIHNIYGTTIIMRPSWKDDVLGLDWEDDKFLVVHPFMEMNAIVEWLVKEYPNVWPGPGLLAQFVVSARATGDPEDFKALESWGFELVTIK